MLGFCPPSPSFCAWRESAKRSSMLVVVLCAGGCIDDGASDVTDDRVLHVSEKESARDDSINEEICSCCCAIGYDGAMPGGTCISIGKPWASKNGYVLPGPKDSTEE